MNTTLLYLGSDIDVQPLCLLRPWESHAVFVDDFHSGGLGLTAWYLERHKNDPRPSFRTTTDALRRMDHLKKMAALDSLLEARLRESGLFSNVRRISTMPSGYSFVFQGLPRTLALWVHGMPLPSEPLHAWEPRMRSLHGRVSTIVFMGSGKESLFMLARKVGPRWCADSVRFVCSEGDYDHWVAKPELYGTTAPSKLPRHVHKIHYPTGDALVGKSFDVVEGCVPIPRGRRPPAEMTAEIARSLDDASS